MKKRKSINYKEFKDKFFDYITNYAFLTKNLQSLPDLQFDDSTSYMKYWGIKYTALKNNKTNLESCAQDKYSSVFKKDIIEEIDLFFGYFATYTYEIITGENLFSLITKPTSKEIDWIPRQNLLNLHNLFINFKDPNYEVVLPELPADTGFFFYLRSIINLIINKNTIPIIEPVFDLPDKRLITILIESCHYVLKQHVENTIKRYEEKTKILKKTRNLHFIIYLKV